MLQAVLQARLPVVVLLQLRKEKMTIAQAQQGLLHAAPRRRQLQSSELKINKVSSRSQTSTSFCSSSSEQGGHTPAAAADAGGGG